MNKYNFKMKKTSKILFLFIGLIIIMSSCKKGENDPFLSMQTRKAKITGEWKLTSGNINVKIYNEGTLSSDATETYDGEYRYYNHSNTSFDTIVYISTFNFKDDMTYTNEVIRSFSFFDNQYGAKYTKITNHYDGEWYFAEGDDIYKNKERITYYATVLKTYYPDSTVTEEKTSIHEVTFVLDKLTNKEMIFRYDSPENSTTEITGYMIFEKN